jgi:hypothetical protein
LPPPIEAAGPRTGRQFSCVIHGGCRVEARPSGSQGDGGGYTDFEGRATTLSRHHAGSLVPFDGPCHALDEAPPVEPPERTSGTSRAVRQWGPRSNLLLLIYCLRKRSKAAYEVSSRGPRTPGGEPRAWPTTTDDPGPQAHQNHRTSKNGRKVRPDASTPGRAGGCGGAFATSAGWPGARACAGGRPPG